MFIYRITQCKQASNRAHRQLRTLVIMSSAGVRQLTCRGTSMSCSTWNGSQNSFCVSLLCRLITPPVPLASLAAEDRRRDLVYSTSVRPDCEQHQTWSGLEAQGLGVQHIREARLQAASDLVRLGGQPPTGERG